MSDLLNAFNELLTDAKLGTSSEDLRDGIKKLQAKCGDYEKALSAILSNYTMPHCIADIAENVLAKHKE